MRKDVQEADMNFEGLFQQRLETLHRPRSGATRPVARNVFANVFSLRRLTLPSPPCWSSWIR
jgi:hypothetical protein